MPIYKLKHSETEEVKEVTCSISKMEEYKKEGWVTIPYVTKLASDRGGENINKTSQAWRDHLGKIKSESGMSNTIKL